MVRASTDSAASAVSMSLGDHGAQALELLDRREAARATVGPLGRILVVNRSDAPDSPARPAVRVDVRVAEDAKEPRAQVACPANCVAVAPRRG